MAATPRTLSDLIFETKYLALSQLREEVNQLSNSMSMSTAGATDYVTPNFPLGTMGAPGVVIEIDYELMLIMLVSGSTCTVIRGWMDSDISAHSHNAIITVKPQFPCYTIINALNEEIDDLSSPENGLYQTLECTLTYNPVITGYDFTDVNTEVAVLPEKLIEVLEVRCHDYGPAQEWPIIEPSRIRVQRNSDTSIYPSGLGLQIAPGANLFPGQSIRVQYKAAFNSILQNATDSVTAITGLPATACDIPPMGAMIRLMAPREFKRTFMNSQGEPRRASEVPVGASITAIKAVMQRYQQRIDAERVKLELQTNRIYR